MIPEVPSGSYFALGLVINSTLSIADEGICSNTALRSVPVSVEGLPSINTVMFPLPLKLKLPSKSTLIEGIVCNTSFAEPPVESTFFSTLKTFLSIAICNMPRSAFTVACANCLTEEYNFTTPKTTSGFAGFKNRVSLVKET